MDIGCSDLKTSVLNYYAALSVPSFQLTGNPEWFPSIEQSCNLLSFTVGRFCVLYEIVTTQMKAVQRYLSIILFLFHRFTKLSLKCLFNFAIWYTFLAVK